MNLSTNITYSDWTHLYGTWGEPGVRRIIDFCQAGGLKKIYWRFFDGGIANYHSQIERVANGQHHGDKEVIAQFDAPGIIKQFNWPGFYEAVRNLGGYTRWDPVGEAISYAHRKGLKFYAWVSLENEHGGGHQSRLAAEHPEYAHVDRWGNVETGCLSFSFPEVRRYKLALIKEIVRMPIDGLWLDFGRCAPSHRMDPKGVNVLGYDQVAVKEFKGEFGIDPREIPNEDERWVHFRARYSTLFLRELVAELKKLKWAGALYADIPGSSVEASVPEKFADVASWCREKLVDGVVGGYYGFPIPKGPKKVFRRRIWKAHPDIIEQLVAVCDRHGFDEVMFQESDNIHTEYMWNTLARLSISPCYPSKPMRGVKALKAPKTLGGIAVLGKKLPWSKADKADNFIEHTQIEPAYAPVKTEARFLWDAKYLFVRLECRGCLKAKEKEKNQNLKIDGGNPSFGSAGNEWVMICLDTEHDHQTCAIFRVNRGGECQSFRRTHDEPLEHWGNGKDDARNHDIRFSAHVIEERKGWTAILAIPFGELKARPQIGKRWGLNLCRFVPVPNGNELKTTKGGHFAIAECILCSWAGKRHDQFWTEPKDYGHLWF